MKIAENPLAGGTLLNWLRLWKENGVERKYFLRVVYITAMTILFSPVRALQGLFYGRKMESTEIKQDPVFVIGHYRCGGTYLMNLMTRDPQWGFLSTTQALLPDMFLLGKPIRDIFKLFLHEKRPMDNVLVTPESPEEPEHAIGNIIPYGFYQGFCFPDRMMEYFNNSVLFEGDKSGVIRSSLGEMYLKVLKACTLAVNGKQLLIKNPPDTARIPLLLKMFPDAKFIFLYRNPYVMFPSNRNFYNAYIVDWQLKDVQSTEIEENILLIYKQMMERYQADKHLIPEGNLVEIKFEDFEQHPLETMRTIYKDLNLEGFEDSVPAFEVYIDSQKGYVKNQYSLTREEINRIHHYWSADIERWRYTPEDAAGILE